MNDGRTLVNEICAALAGAEWSDPWGGGHDAWKVGGKMFACVGTMGDGVSVKTASVEEAAFLIEMGRAVKAPYFHRSWVKVGWDVPEDEMADRLTRLRADADRDGKSLKVFHWSPVELTQSARFPRVAAALSGVSVDLMAWFNREFFARGSSSIKAVAPLLGFDWGTEDAGGLTSQLRIEEARGTGPAAEAARAWCLRYNEDDVAAQAAIRDGLRRLGDAPRRT